MICPYYVVFSIVPVRGFFRYGALTSLLSSPLESAPSFLRPTKSLMPWSRRPPFSPTDHVGISMSTIKDDGDTMPHPLSSQENFAASTNPSDDEFRDHDLDHYLQVAESAALQAGNFIRASLERRTSLGLTVNDKAAVGAARVDLVTEVDLQAEEIIIPSIRKAVTGRHIFVGEESAFLTGTQALTDDPHWFVDPVDGTTNFIHGYPFVTVGRAGGRAQAASWGWEGGEEGV
ncbi:inositol monophosphatase [Nannochloropsis gaditana]|uniref:Inositol monophosphatase n=1 Tax=Nannochloropsis gaditana TaxID=72520 RepID=W7TKF3_9STRA|nr:inositol monophosphatase [Nannochloropsis gaditana]